MCIYMCVCVRAIMHALHVPLCVCMYTCTCMCVSVSLDVCTCTCIHLVSQLHVVIVFINQISNQLICPTQINYNHFNFID